MKRSRSAYLARRLPGIALILSALASFPAGAGSAPQPLLAAGHPVTWWFVFKFNAESFPQCGGNAARYCAFGGDVQDYGKFGQQFAYASSADPNLQKGGDVCLGDGTTDPVGATFGEVYGGKFHYVVWNDQFYGDPAIPGCSKECASPWGHSKGLLAWNDEGEGLVLQVSTPSWPASGNQGHPRQTDGNTLGCVADNDVLVSQHFFALQLSPSDLRQVLKALANASVATDPSDPELVDNGGPADVQALVASLGHKSASTAVVVAQLSSGVRIISKPSALHVPPWQLVSAELGGIPLRAATWWASPKIPSTTADSDIECWDATLGAPGPVQIATTGTWAGTALGLTGTASAGGNHAKIGVSTDGHFDVAIFGDLNQQGTLAGDQCGRSQNGRGGVFYVLHDSRLSHAVTGLIDGASAPAK